MSVLAPLKRSRAARFLLAGPLAVRRQWLRRQERVHGEILDRIARDVRGDLVVRVEEHDGEFALSPRSHLARRVLRNGVFEPEIAELFYRHVDPARDIIDVGANVGFFTVGGARRLTTGRVLAAEPTPGAFARLTRNVAHNGVADRVILFNGLVSDAEGEFEINAVDGMEEYSSMGSISHPSMDGMASAAFKAPALRLDDLVSRHGLNPALIKVDVEGAEHMVFAGAVETLKRYRPFVISELSEPLLRNLGGSAAGVVAFFEGLGYRVIDPMDPRAKPGQRAFGDIFCIPSDVG